MDDSSLFGIFFANFVNGICVLNLNISETVMRIIFRDHAKEYESYVPDLKDFIKRKYSVKKKSSFEYRSVHYRVLCPTDALITKPKSPRDTGRL